MKKRILLMVIFVIVSSTVFAQMKIEINGLTSIGYTIVDVEEAAGEIDGTIYQDWGEFYWSIRTQGLYLIAENIKAGVEIGYQNLFWYYAEIPYPLTRTVYVDPVNISGVFEYELSEMLFLQGGAGGYFYDDGTAFGLFSSLNYKWKLNESISIPAFVRVDTIFALGFTMPISAGAGINYRL